MKGACPKIGFVARYRVSPSGWRGHRTIGAALTAAGTTGRAVVEIEAGTYREQLVLRGDVELVALGSVILTSEWGPTVETVGDVRLSGLRIIAENGEAVRCSRGSLTVENCYAEAHEVCLHSASGTTTTLRDSGFHVGRVEFFGAAGLAERCRFTDGINNGIAVFNGSRVRIDQCHVANSRIHGIRVKSAQAQITGCTVTGTGSDSITADSRGDMTISGCRITDVRRSGIAYIEGSRGTVTHTTVTDSQHGIAVVSGADPVVRSCTFTNCAETGINVHSQGRGRFEQCEVVNAGDIGVFSKDEGDPTVTDVVVREGNVGIALDRGRGSFERIRVHDLRSVGIRLLHDAAATVRDAVVANCPNGFEAADGSKAELTGVAFRDFRMTAVTITGTSRITLKDVTATRGQVGIGVGERGQLALADCRVEDVEKLGVIVFGDATFKGERLAVVGGGTTEIGIGGYDRTYLELTGGEFTDLRMTGLTLADSCAAKITDCAVTGEQGLAVLHHGHADLVRLRTSLPVKEIEEEAEPQVVNNYYGPVFNAAVHGVQLAWNNQGPVTQQQHNNSANHEVGAGVGGWRVSFKRLHAALGLGAPTSAVEKHGPGVAQFGDGWVLCGVLDQPPVAVTEEIWDALHHAGAATPDAATALGLPVGTTGSEVDDQAREVELRGGTWGDGRLVRTGETWSWEPVPSFTADTSAGALDWMDGTAALRVRVVARLPWAQKPSLRPDADPVAALTPFLRWFPADASWVPGARPDVHSWSTTGGQNMQGEVILDLTGPIAVVCVETRLARPPSSPLTWAGFAGWFEAAWQVATEVLPGVLTPAPARWTAPPTVELRMDTTDSCADFSVFAESQRPATMTVMITAPPRLTLAREAVLHMLHHQGFGSATAAIFDVT